MSGLHTELINVTLTLTYRYQCAYLKHSSVRPRTKA